MTEDDQGKPIGLIESCVDGAPLSRFEGGVNGRSRLEIIAGVAAAVHQLPKSEFSHLPTHTDSASQVRTDLEALAPSLYEEWPVAADARDWITAHLPARPGAVLHGDCCRKTCFGIFTTTDASRSSTGNAPGSAIPPTIWPS